MGAPDPRGLALAVYSPPGLGGLSLFIGERDLGGSMFNRRNAFVLCILAATATAFAGCERLTKIALHNSTSEAVTAAPPSPVVGVAMEDFSVCHPQGTGAASCLSARGVLPSTWTQA